MGAWREAVAAPWRPSLFATSTFEGEARLCDLDRRELGTPFASVYEFGGRRLAVARSGEEPVAVVGAWARHGVVGYSSDGEELWQQRAFTNVQVVCATQQGHHVLVCLERGPMHVLDAANGEVLARVSGVRDVYTDPAAGWLAARDGRGLLLLSETGSERQWRVPARGFAVLACAFVSDAVVFSETAGDGPAGEDAAGVRALDLADGSLRWEWRAPAGSLVLGLARGPDDSAVTGVQRFVNHDHPDRLITWTASGDASVVREMPIGDHAFLDDGRHLLTPSGQVCETVSGRSIWSC